MDLKTRLVTEPNDKQAVSDYREVSSVRAAVRALADYLRDVTFPIDGGKHTSFSVVREMKAEPEDKATYPAASVYVDGNIEYDSDTGTFEQYLVKQFPKGGLYINGDVSMELTVHVWTNEDLHRENALMALEDASNPVNWMTGFRLEMPYYHSLRADFLLLRMQYEDSEADNQRRYRKLVMQFQAKTPYARFLSLPEIKAKPLVDFAD